MTILTTKFYTPPKPSKIVPRSELFGRLDRAHHAKLTLISAPAGFGKSTLVADWLTTVDEAYSWLSLDTNDGYAQQFWQYVVYALDKIHAEMFDQIIEMLNAPQLPPIEAFLTGLVNHIALIDDHFYLVLDDYHLIQNEDVDQGMAFLLEHMPPQMHLIIITREDPDLPLARLRTKRQLIEIRTEDLRFSPAETSDFLNQLMELGLSETDIDILESRTEGWIAGLQLAAISIQHNDDTHQFIETFTGSHRYIMDYLVEEVLYQQPDEIQEFLLYTSLLHQFCGSLCDAVMPQLSRSSQDIIQYLERSNLFIIPLDDERNWYRYHHLFAELLQKRLQQMPHITDELTDSILLRASHWYIEQGQDITAFRYAVLANDIDRAETIIAGDGMPLHFRGGARVILDWLESLPADMLEARPLLWVTYAMVLTFAGKPIQGIEQKLSAIEDLLQTYTPDERTQDLVGQIASIRAMLAIPNNETEKVMEQSIRALDYLHPDNLPVRTNTTWTLGFAYHAMGKRKKALDTYQEVVSISEHTNNHMMRHAAILSLGNLYEEQNQLQRAYDILSDELASAGDPPSPTFCTAHWTLSTIHYQWNELETAEYHAQESIRLGQLLDNIEIPANGGLIIAKIHLAHDDVEPALAAINAAEAFLHQRGLTHALHTIAEARVEVALHQNDQKTANVLLNDYDLPLHQARVDMMQGRVQEALSILENQHQISEDNEWERELLQVDILLAKAYFIDNQLEAALDKLTHALTRAQEHQFVRIFTDEGQAMRDLLSEAKQQSIMPDYVAKLLKSFDSQSTQQPLIDPLSDREIEVLQLIAEGLSNQDIADQLFLALDTVKGHNRRIYAKLAVRRRTEAVATARELGII